eukprot:Pgem_evm3s7246
MVINFEKYQLQSAQVSISLEPKPNNKENKEYKEYKEYNNILKKVIDFTRSYYNCLIKAQPDLLNNQFKLFPVKTKLSTAFENFTKIHYQQQNINEVKTGLNWVVFRKIKPRSLSQIQLDSHKSGHSFGTVATNYLFPRSWLKYKITQAELITEQNLK